MSNASDSVIENGVLKKYKGPGGDVTIPAGVTRIGDWAFEDCSSLTSVTIPAGVTSIGNQAFSGCSSLTSVTIPAGVTSIGDWAFSRCRSLTSVTIPAGVTRIGDYAFSGCSSLTSMTIPAGVTSIGGGAFNGTALYNDSSNWENGVLYVGKTLIAAEDLHGEYSIREGTRCIGDGAFCGCSSLTGVTIPAGVTSIGDWALYGCSSLTSVTIPAGVTSIGDRAFYGCSSLTSVTIPDSVRSIGDSAFYGCSSLTSVTIPESVTLIGDEAFRYCSGLKKFEMLADSKLEKIVFGKATKPERIMIGDPGNVPAAFRPAAAVGYAEDPAEPGTEREKKHLKYIKSNAAKLLDRALSHPALLGLMCEKKLLTPETAELYLAAAQEQGKTDAVAQLLDYQQNKLTGKEKEKAAQKAETREEKVTDFIFSAEAIGKLQGKVFVVTGALKSFTREEFKACLDACGAVLSETLNEQTDYLITNTPDSGSAKNKKAEQLGVKKLSEAEFNRLIGRA